MKRMTAVALMATGLFFVPGTALADVEPETFPEAGDKCSHREARDTVHLPDGSVLECDRERGKFVWKLVSGPTEPPVDDEEEEEEETDPEPEPSPEPSPSPSPDPDENEDEDGDDTEPGEGDEDEGEDETEEEEQEDTTVGGDTDPAEKEEVTKVETVSGGSDTLPVTGGALTGLVLAGLATLGLGGAATYFTRKTKA